MKFDGRTAGVVFGLMGLASGITCAITSLMTRMPINGIWFGLLGAAIGLSSATIGVAVYYADRKRRGLRETALSTTK